MTGHRGFYRTDRQHYVNRLELLQQQAARRQLEELALQASIPSEAMPASRMSPFLAYHTHCSREVCVLAEREGERLGVRLLVILSAYNAVQSARQR